MTEETPNPKTVDLAVGVLAGRTFPKTTVPIFFDEEAQYKLNLLNRALSVASEEEHDGIKAKRDELLKSLSEHTYLVHLTGVSRRLKEDLLNALLAEFPQEVETNFLGQKTVKDNPEADRAYADRRLALHIEKVVHPSGDISLGSLETAQFIRYDAPEAALAAVEKAVFELESGAKSGYETAVQDLDF